MNFAGGPGLGPPRGRKREAERDDELARSSRSFT